MSQSIRVAAMDVPRMQLSFLAAACAAPVNVPPMGWECKVESFIAAIFRLTPAVTI
jgi:hypothetical protein